MMWIGGATGSGKTTVTRAFAGRHGLRVFPIDAFWYSHAARMPEPEPSPDEQWLGSSPAEQAAEFEALTRRRWPLVLADLATLPATPPVAVEGPQVLPDLIPAGDAAVFLIATPQWQHAVLSQRPLPSTKDDRRALTNRIEKDRLYGVRIAELARDRGFPIVLVDGSRPVLDDVERALPEAVGRRVDPVVVREARRWENDVVAENIQAWLSTEHVPPTMPSDYPFACECGQAGCSAVVSLTLPTFQALRQVVAEGHPAALRAIG